MKTRSGSHRGGRPTVLAFAAASTLASGLLFACSSSTDDSSGGDGAGGYPGFGGLPGGGLPGFGGAGGDSAFGTGGGTSFGGSLSTGGTLGGGGQVGSGGLSGGGMAGASIGGGSAAGASGASANDGGLGDSGTSDDGGLAAGGASSGGSGNGGASSGGSGNGGASSGGSGNGGASSGGASSGGQNGSGGASPACTGKPGNLKGKTDHANFDAGAGGANRHFILYRPASLDPNTPVPVVIVPHGDTMSAQNMYDVTGYPAKADKEGFVVAFPTGETGDNGPLIPGPWNVGTGVCGAGAFAGNTGNDQAFMDAILDYIETDQCVDHGHVYMTGFSMGGYFSNETMCVNDRFRAAGPASGGTHDLSTCLAGHKPVIIFHGTADPLISSTCGSGARDLWAAKNGCKTTTTSVTVTGGHCEYSDGCPADGQVVLCLFDGMGHAWPGGTGTFGDATKASAADLGWDFFKKYAW